MHASCAHVCLCMICMHDVLMCAHASCARRRAPIQNEAGFEALRGFQKVFYDVLEGMLQYETKLVLRHCVVSKEYFQLSFLNMHIDNYQLGFMEAAN